VPCTNHDKWHTARAYGKEDNDKDDCRDSQVTQAGRVILEFGRR
jgi:hypothetical protein